MALLAIGYSLANPAPKKCNRKHPLEARVAQPAYYVFADPNQQEPYPYDDPSMFPSSHPDQLAQAQIRKIDFHLIWEKMNNL